MVGDGGFVAGTLAQLIWQEIQFNSTRPVIFSPFRMGILDLALGKDSMAKRLPKT